jgi:hypothetical protein
MLYYDDGIRGAFICYLIFRKGDLDEELPQVSGQDRQVLEKLPEFALCLVTSIMIRLKRQRGADLNAYFT